MTEVLAATIRFALTNYALTSLLLALAFALVAILVAPKPLAARLVVEKLLSWYVFFAVGVYFLDNFVMHAFFGAMTARVIGWADSPFQLEVATASLGFAVVGFLAAWRSFDLRLAAIVGPAFFQWGAAAGHVYQMVTAHNFAPGNAGVIFYMDILIPLYGFVLLWLDRRGARGQRPGGAGDR